MDPLTEFLLLLGLSVVAHMVVAYLFAPRAAVRRLKAFFRSDPEAAELIASRFPSAVEAWLETEQGRATVGRWVDTVGETIRARLQSWLEGMAGGQAKRADSKATTLLDGAIRFGNPVLDGIWGMIPPAEKRRFLGRVASLLRQGALSEVGGNPEEEASAVGYQ